MKIRMLTRAAGPDGIMEPGVVLDMLPVNALRLVKEGWAVLVDVSTSPLTPPLKGRGIEDAVVNAPENTMISARHKKKK